MFRRTICSPTRRTQISRALSCCFLGLLAACVGCGGPRPTPGGTTGTLTIAGQPAGDMQVSIYELEEEAAVMLGFGVTDSDGFFELFTSGAKGPLWLKTGDYIVTVESAGAPVQPPLEYQQPRTSPLKIAWDESTAELELVVPENPPG